MSKQKDHVNIRITREVYRRLKILCAKKGMKISEALSELLK